MYLNISYYVCLYFSDIILVRFCIFIWLADSRLLLFILNNCSKSFIATEASLFWIKVFKLKFSWFISFCNSILSLYFCLCSSRLFISLFILSVKSPTSFCNLTYSLYINFSKFFIWSGILILFYSYFIVLINIYIYIFIIIKSNIMFISIFNFEFFWLFYLLFITLSNWIFAFLILVSN